MSYGLGLKALRRLCVQQDTVAWHRSRLDASLFVGEEVECFKWIDTHLRTHHVLPHIETLESMFPDVKQVETPEPASYYVAHVESRYKLDLLKSTMKDSTDLLKDQKFDEVEKKFRDALASLTRRKHKTKILDMGAEGPVLVTKAYHKMGQIEKVCSFGWPYMDDSTGGILPGDLVSIVGRPALGKTWHMLSTALHNWRTGKNALFVSMEMGLQSIAQRAAAMFAHTNIAQLKVGKYSTSTYKKFAASMVEMSHLGPQKFYVVDGNLSVHIEELYDLVTLFDIDGMWIDGAYLVKNPNKRLGRYEKVAENAEYMKRMSGELEISTFASWQFGRDATKKVSKNQKVGLEDIAYSDAIGQVSTIVLGLLQEEGIETMVQRVIDVLKGRNGEVGQFSVNWDFATMDFSQVGTVNTTEELSFV